MRVDLHSFFIGNPLCSREVKISSTDSQPSGETSISLVSSTQPDMVPPSYGFMRVPEAMRHQRIEIILP